MVSNVVASNADYDYIKKKEALGIRHYVRIRESRGVVISMSGAYCRAVETERNELFMDYSVIIPTRNAEKYIVALLDSIQEQTL